MIPFYLCVLSGVIFSQAESASTLYRIYNNTNKGILEYYRSDTNEWTQVCDDSSNFSPIAAKIVCREMGYSTGIQIPTSSVSSQPLTPNIYLDDIMCYNTSYADISKCYGVNTGGFEYCRNDMSLVVAVFCNDPPLYKIHGNSLLKGFVEYYDVFSERWTHVCNDKDSFSPTAAEIVCRGLGFSVGKVISSSVPSSQPSNVNFYLADVNCKNRSDTDIGNCGNFNGAQVCLNDTKLAAALECSQYRIYGNANQGLLEYFDVASKNWTFVCNNNSNFSPISANIVCQSLGYSSGKTINPLDASSQPTSLNFLLDNVLCTNPNEKDIGNCSQRTGANNCFEVKDAVAVECLMTTPSTSTTSTTTTTQASSAATVRQVCNNIASITSSSNSGIDRFYPVILPQYGPSQLSTKTILENCKQISSRQISPSVLDNTSPTQVEIVFDIASLMEVSTIGQSIQVKAGLLQKWQVESCNINNSYSQDNVTGLVAVYDDSPQEIWVPEIRMASSSSRDIFIPSYGHSTDLTVAWNRSSKTTILQFYWTTEDYFASRCIMDLSKFPFDQQRCVFVFSFVQSQNYVQFHQATLIWNELKETPEWHLTSMSYIISTRRYRGLTVSSVEFEVVITRIPSYYVRSFIIPIFLLGLLGVSTFLIPPKFPERAGFAITVVLALTVAQSNVLKEIPKASHRILLMNYVELVTWHCSACALTHMIWMCCKSSKIFKNPRHLRIADIFSAIVAAIAYIAIHVVLFIVI